WLEAWGEPRAGAQFRLTLPRAAGAVLRESPIPLEPVDRRGPRLPPVPGPHHAPEQDPEVARDG
ncbi:MAG TPA: hypothetical protein VE081_10575, partial [Sporichthyaceae bacterium]|nr:hypothetical protein [Sporichthyaceae bacterium]